MTYMFRDLPPPAQPYKGGEEKEEISSLQNNQRTPAPPLKAAFVLGERQRETGTTFHGLGWLCQVPPGTAFCHRFLFRRRREGTGSIPVGGLCDSVTIAREAVLSQGGRRLRG